MCLLTTTRRDLFSLEEEGEEEGEEGIDGIAEAAARGWAPAHGAERQGSQRGVAERQGSQRGAPMIKSVNSWRRSDSMRALRRGNSTGGSLRRAAEGDAEGSPADGGGDGDAGWGRGDGDREEEARGPFCPRLGSVRESTKEEEDGEGREEGLVVGMGPLGGEVVKEGEGEGGSDVAHESSAQPPAEGGFDWRLIWGGMSSSGGGSKRSSASSGSYGVAAIEWLGAGAIDASLERVASQREGSGDDGEEQEGEEGSPAAAEGGCGGGHGLDFSRARRKSSHGPSSPSVVTASTGPNSGSKAWARRWLTRPNPSARAASVVRITSSAAIGRGTMTPNAHVMALAL